MAQPSPMSTTPAFSSPALTRIDGPLVGNFFNSRREFLYEQCSLHMTEKMPSSVKFGSRPRIFLMRSNSSGVRPCFATISGVTDGSTAEAGIVGHATAYRYALNDRFFRICRLGDRSNRMCRSESED